MSRGQSPLRMRVKVEGPFFKPTAGRTFSENIRDMLGAMASEGEKDVKAQMPRITGRTAEGVKGRVSSLRGRKWMLHAVVSQTRIFPWKNHRTAPAMAEYRGGKLEAKTRAFKRTTTALRASGKVAGADLTKGLN